MSEYPVYPIPFKPPRLIGLSESLLTRHYESDYGAVVRALNNSEPDWSDPRRIALNNSAELHEVYFDCLGGADGLGGPAGEPFGLLAQAIADQFGSVSDWQNEWQKAAQGTATGAGSLIWLVLGRHTRHGELISYAVDNELAAPTGCVPVMALDLADHAYQAEFGSDRAAYISAFFDNLHWARANARWVNAGLNLSGTHDANPMGQTTVEHLRDRIAAGQSPLLIDVCLAEDRCRRHDRLPGAQMVSPEQLQAALADMPRDREVVAYCLYGYQVSANAVTALRHAGIQASQLRGGIAAWHAMNGPTEALQ